MIFLDINTFFSSKAGGIRTYHRAKIEWFKSHPEHDYFMVYPGAARKRRKEGGNVTLVEAMGPALTGDPSGYRLLLDFIHVFRVIRRAGPQVLEAGDPWLTGLFCLFLKKTGLYRGLLVSFYHSDPVPTYLEPWASRGALQSLRRVVLSAAATAFYRLQGSYDLTAVSSRTMEERLKAKGVRTVAHLPFGVPELFLAGDPSARSGSGHGEGDIQILYAGRLDRDKGVDLLLDALPKLLHRTDIRVTVIGRGARATRFAAFRHPRYRCPGFIADQAEVRAIYDGHHILVAPGPHETFGLGVLEAMARGLVVVGPDQGGTGELLREAGSPFVFRAGDSGDFLRILGLAIGCDWNAESARSRALALRYGTWNESIGRMVKRYAARLGTSLP